MQIAAVGGASSGRQAEGGRAERDHRTGQPQQRGRGQPGQGSCEPSAGPRNRPQRSWRTCRCAGPHEEKGWPLNACAVLTYSDRHLATLSWTCGGLSVEVILHRFPSSHAGH